MSFGSLWPASGCAFCAAFAPPAAAFTCLALWSWLAALWLCLRSAAWPFSVSLKSGKDLDLPLDELDPPELLLDVFPWPWLWPWVWPPSEELEEPLELVLPPLLVQPLLLS